MELEKAPCEARFSATAHKRNPKRVCACARNVMRHAMTTNKQIL